MLRRVQAIIWSGLWICSCTASPPSADAGHVAVDASSIDAGISDVQVIECPNACPGQCVGDRCVYDEAECASDSDCDGGEQCSVSGSCYTGDCLSHGDCPADQRCASDRCIPRVTPESGVMFERVEIANVYDHNSVLIDPETGYPPAGASADMGFGAALLDVDGDLDLDLFIGSQGQNIGGSPACIYINESQPAQLSFRPDPEFCQNRPVDLAAGFGTDLNADGYHELIATGLFVAQLHVFHPERRVVDLLALLPEGDHRRRCFASSAITIDLNFDGQLDLIIGCAVGPMDRNIGVDEVSYHNLAFLFDQEGAPRFLDRSEWNREAPILLEAQGITLGLGAADINHDGLLDLLVSEDRRIMDPDIDYLDPGGVYLRCPPTDNCGFRVQRYGATDNEFGAYMGTGLIHIGDQGEFVYVTDETYNRLIHFPEGQTVDLATALGVELAFMGRHRFFSWGVVVDDFNRDGYDDLFISNGSVMSPDIDAFNAHFDVIFLQNERGFSLHSGDLGISPFTHDDSLSEDRPYSSRAAIKSDLDFDGFIDLIGLGLEGRARLHREVPNTRPDPPRCSLVPIDRYVPAYGFGHTLISPDGQRRRWDSQGQNRSGTSPYVLSPWTRGSLRFASGAEVPFDCDGKPGPIVVSEPEWLKQSMEGDQLNIERTDTAPAGALSVYAEPSGEWFEATDQAINQVRLPAGTTHWMLKFDDQWLARRFTRSEIAP